MAGSDQTTAIVFWVVTRRKDTQEIIRAKPFRTHEEAIHYDLAATGERDLANEAEVSIQILAAGKTPK